MILMLLQGFQVLSINGFPNESLSININGITREVLCLAPSMWSLAPLARVTELCVGAVSVKNSILREVLFTNGFPN